MNTTPHTTRHPPHTTLAYLILLLSQHIAAFLLLPLIIASALLTLLWIGLPFVILTGTLLRTLATSQRHTLTHLTHQPLKPTYHPIPHNGINRRASTLITDPATWKDLLWLISAPLSLLILAIPPTLTTHALSHPTTALTPNPHHIYDLPNPHTLPPASSYSPSPPPSSTSPTASPTPPSPSTPASTTSSSSPPPKPASPPASNTWPPAAPTPSTPKPPKSAASNATSTTAPKPASSPSA